MMGCQSWLSSQGGGWASSHRDVSVAMPALPIPPSRATWRQGRLGASDLARQVAQRTAIADVDGGRDAAALDRIDDVGRRYGRPFARRACRSPTMLLRHEPIGP